MVEEIEKLVVQLGFIEGQLHAIYSSGNCSDEVKIADFYPVNFPGNYIQKSIRVVARGLAEKTRKTLDEIEFIDLPTDRATPMSQKERDLFGEVYNVCQGVFFPKTDNKG